MVISLFEVYFLVIEHSFVKEEFKHQKAPKNFPSSSWESNSRPSEFRGEFKWNESSRWKFSGKKVIPFEVSPFFPFLPKRPKYSVPFVCITSARLQVERKRKIYLYFVNGTLNPVPVFGAKKYQYHLTDVFRQIPVQKIYILDNYTGAFRKLAKAKINVLNKTRGKS